jgi:proline racemase
LAIVPRISGRGWITGLFTYLVDPSDPWPGGFQLADMLGVSGRMSQ